MYDSIFLMHWTTPWERFDDVRKAGAMVSSTDYGRQTEVDDVVCETRYMFLE